MIVKTGFVAPFATRKILRSRVGTREFTQEILSRSSPGIFIPLFHLSFGFSDYFGKFPVPGKKNFREISTLLKRRGTVKDDATVLLNVETLILSLPLTKK